MNFHCSSLFIALAVLSFRRIRRNFLTHQRAIVLRVILQFVLWIRVLLRIELWLFKIWERFSCLCCNFSYRSWSDYTTWPRKGSTAFVKQTRLVSWCDVTVIVRPRSPTNWLLIVACLGIVSTEC